MGDFIRNNFPTLLLSLFVLIFTAVCMVIFVKLGANKDAVNWATTSFAGFMGALLGLLTGHAIGSAATRKLEEPPK